MDPDLAKIHPRPEDSRWKIEKREIVVKNEFVRFIHDTGVTDKGKKFDYHFLDFPFSVGIIALTNKSEMILIKQYRYPINKEQIEIPSGGGEDAEDSKIAAERELMEETGYKAKHIEKIGKFSAYMVSNDITHVYLATGCEKKGKQNPDDTEFGLEVELHPVDKVFEMVQDGKIHHGFSLACLMLARPHILSAE